MWSPSIFALYSTAVLGRLCIRFHVFIYLGAYNILSCGKEHSCVLCLLKIAKSKRSWMNVNIGHSVLKSKVCVTLWIHINNSRQQTQKYNKFWFRSGSVAAVQGRILQINVGYCGPYMSAWTDSPAQEFSSQTHAFLCMIIIAALIHKFSFRINHLLVLAMERNSNIERRPTLRNQCS
jgi:ribosomal protein L21E